MSTENRRRYRLEGLLLDSRRGPILQIDDGGVWALATEDNVRRMFGQRVTVEGVRSGFDRLDVEWMASAGSL